MKNTFGNSLFVTIFGESHGEAVGAVIDGIAPGIAVDEEFIKARLSIRRPDGVLSTARIEADSFKILSGVFNGKTTGTPLCIVIENQNKKSADYSKLFGKARPGHADYSAFCKYHGYEDYRGGGHFSGRITAAVVAAAAVILPALEKKGIHIGTHILRCAGISDREFDDLNRDIEFLNNPGFGMLSHESEAAAKEKIADAKKAGNSVGGVLQTVITGVPAGVGEPWFDTAEGELAKAMFSIPAIKGVEFGKGFLIADMEGSVANDPFCVNNGSIETVGNNNGGINGGITNGMPILINCAVKPTPSIALPQDTVDFHEYRNTNIEITGRHDPCIVSRARVVADSMAAITVADLLCSRFGTDWLGEA